MVMHGGHNMYLNNIFNLVTIIRNKFKKSSINEEVDEYTSTYISISPGVEILKDNQLTEEQYNIIRKKL